MDFSGLIASLEPDGSNELVFRSKHLDMASLHLIVKLLEAHKYNKSSIVYKKPLATHAKTAKLE